MAEIKIKSSLRGSVILLGLAAVAVSALVEILGAFLIYGPGGAWPMAIVIAVSAALALILIVLISRRIASPYRSMARELSSGNFTARLTQGTGGEAGLISSQVNEYLSRLAYLAEELTGMSTQLVSSLERMTATTIKFSDNAQNSASSVEQITASIEEISSGMESEASNIETQFTNLDGMTEKMHQLSSISKETLDKTGSALLMISDMSSSASSGEVSMNVMSSSMSTIFNSSNEMTNIVQIINDISDRINLLSLNAAIEAARAGDSGRGFAVVADEISKLADQTAVSIKEIDTLIIRNNEEMKKGQSHVVATVGMIKAITEGIGTIRAMVDTVAGNMGRLHEIHGTLTHEADEIKLSSGEIRHSTQEQQLAVEEIVKSISQINEATQSIAQGSEEIASSTVEVASISQALRDRIHYLS